LRKELEPSFTQQQRIVIIVIRCHHIPLKRARLDRSFSILKCEFAEFVEIKCECETFPASVVDEPICYHLLLSKNIQFTSDIPSSTHLAAEEERVVMGAVD